MGWKDTVMSDDAIKKEFIKYGFDIVAEGEIIDKIGNVIAITREAQAEVSFKAGEQFGIAEGMILKVKDFFLLNESEVAELNNKANAYLDAVKQEGIREVVEWIMGQVNFEDDEVAPYYVLNKKVWQAKLKKWFKNNPELLKELGVK